MIVKATKALSSQKHAFLDTFGRTTFVSSRHFISVAVICMAQLCGCLCGVIRQGVLNAQSLDLATRLAEAEVVYEGMLAHWVRAGKVSPRFPLVLPHPPPPFPSGRP